MDNTVRKFAVIAKADNEAEILLYDQIGMSFWGDGVTAKQIKAELDKMEKVSRIVLRVNSPGGDVFEGSAIYDLLSQSETPVDVIVDGICASAAFTVTMAGRKIAIGEAGMMMLHNARGGAFGEADDMRHTAEILEKINAQMAGIYAKRSGKSVEDVVALMNAETWLNPQEAVEMGFADSVIEAPERDKDDVAAKMVAALDVTKFRNLPESLKLRVAALATSPKQVPAVTENQTAKAEQESNTMAETNATASAVEVNNDRAVAADIVKLASEFKVNSEVLDGLLREGATLTEAKEACSRIVLARAKDQGTTAGFAAPTVNKMDASERKDYSIARAIRFLAGDDGVEARLEREVSQDIAKSLGRSSNGLFIPTRLNPQMAGLDTKTNGAGKYTVATEMRDLIELLRNKARVIELGATVLSGLSSDISFPVQLTGSAGAWVAENPGSDASESDATFGTKSLSPKTYAATTSFSRKLLAQSSIDIEAMVRNDLATAHAQALDVAAINGLGSSNQPLGLLKTTGIGDVALGAAGDTPDYASIVDLETAIADANADESGMKFLTTPIMRGLLRKTQQFSSTNGVPVWQQLGNSLGVGDVLGYPGYVSKNVPSTLVKTTSSDCHAIIFGYWPGMLIGEWGVIELIVDPYRLKKQGMIEVTSFQMVDVLLRQPAQFAAIQDARTTAAG
jgi:HK97 family phage major capsid protein/ATP-dependent Clp endopeptidase proteolytic subunit ClpP